MNHPFRGLVILHDALVMGLSTNGPSPLLAEGCACLSELARSVLENDKLSLVAYSHAKDIAENIYSPPTTAFLQRHKGKFLTKNKTGIHRLVVVFLICFVSHLFVHSLLTFYFIFVFFFIFFVFFVYNYYFFSKNVVD